MIPIRFVGNEEDIVKDLCARLLESCSKSRKNGILDDLDKWCMKNIVIDNKPMGIGDIIIADFPTIKRIAGIIDDLNDRSITLDAEIKSFITKTMYDKLDKNIIVEKLDLSVCPYCNRSYLNTLRNYKTFQIDHFYPKTKYPVLAVSIYNLVPCCYACNSRKRENLISYSPYNPDYKSADELVLFDYWISDVDYLRNKDSIHLLIESDEIMKSNLTVLEMKELYSTHKREIQNIIRKTVIYPDEYVDDIMYLYGDLFENRAEAEYMVYGYQEGDAFYRNTPLGKLKADISRCVRYSS